MAGNLEGMDISISGNLFGRAKTKIGTTPGFAAQRATFFAQLWNFFRLIVHRCFAIYCFFSVCCLFAALVVRSAGLFLPTASSHSFIVPHMACFFGFSRDGWKVWFCSQEGESGSGNHFMS